MSSESDHEYVNIILGIIDIDLIDLSRTQYRKFLSQNMYVVLK